VRVSRRDDVATAEPSRLTQWRSGRAKSTNARICVPRLQTPPRQTIHARGRAAIEGIYRSTLEPGANASVTGRNVAEFSKIGRVLEGGSHKSRQKHSSGEVAEWLKAPVSKTGRDESPSGVQIPPSPPNKQRVITPFSVCLSADG
jgi:hypothetical protein